MNIFQESFYKFINLKHFFIPLVFYLSLNSAMQIVFVNVLILNKTFHLSIYLYPYVLCHFYYREECFPPKNSSSLTIANITLTGTENFTLIRPELQHPNSLRSVFSQIPLYTCRLPFNFALSFSCSCSGSNMRIKISIMSC